MMVSELMGRCCRIGVVLARSDARSTMRMIVRWHHESDNRLRRSNLDGGPLHELRRLSRDPDEHCYNDMISGDLTTSVAASITHGQWM